jgi:hypothetical protein
MELTKIAEIQPLGYTLIRYSRIAESKEKPIEQQLDNYQRIGLCKYYNKQGMQVHLKLQNTPSEQSQVLCDHAQFFSFAFLDSCKVYAFTKSRKLSIGSSLVKYMHLVNDETWVGVVLNIFKHQQGSNGRLFAEMRWMKALNVTPIAGDPWHE